MIGMGKKAQRADTAQDRAINRIVEGTVFRGTVESEGSFRVDGSFEGDLNIQGRLVIGVQGSVMGVVRCGQCEVEGRMEGDVTVQELLALKFVDRLSNSEIGAIMGRSEGAVKSLYHRTLLSLREEIAPEEPAKATKAAESLTAKWERALNRRGRRGGFAKVGAR